MCVFDITRSMAYLLPALFVALDVLGEVESVPDLRLLCGVSSLVSILSPNYYAPWEFEPDLLERPAARPPTELGDGPLGALRLGCTRAILARRASEGSHGRTLAGASGWYIVDAVIVCATQSLDAGPANVG